MLAEGVVFCALLAAGSWFLLRTDSTKLAPSTHNVETPPAFTGADEFKPLDTVATKPVDAGAKNPATDATTDLISDADRAAMDRILAGAKRAVEESELQRCKRLKIRDSDRSRTEQVLLPAPTKEQLSPIYTALSEGSRVFPPDSAAGIAFRKQADEFAADLAADLKYPMKVLIRELNKEDGAESIYSVLGDEDSAITEQEDGSIKFEGSSVHLEKVPDPRKFAHLFPVSNDQK